MQTERTPRAYAGRYCRQHVQEGAMPPGKDEICSEEKMQQPDSTSSATITARRSRSIGSIRRSCILVGKPDIIETTDMVKVCMPRVEKNLRHHQAWYLELQSAFPGFVQSEASCCSSSPSAFSMNSVFLDIASQIRSLRIS